MYCYQCDAKVGYLFDDGRCSNCTRLAPEEVMGTMEADSHVTPDYEQTALELLAAYSPEEIIDGLNASVAVGSDDEWVSVRRYMRDLAVAALAQQPAASDSWRDAFVAERARRYRDGGMKIEQARIHAESDADLAIALAAQPEGYNND